MNPGLRPPRACSWVNQVGQLIRCSTALEGHRTCSFCSAGVYTSKETGQRIVTATRNEVIVRSDGGLLSFFDRELAVDIKNLSQNQAEPFPRPSGNEATNSIGIGHKTREHNHGTKETEIFANMFQVWSTQDKWDEMKALFPNTASKFELIMKDISSGKFD